LLQKSLPIRRWLSVALGAALLGTSLVTGLNTANASVGLGITGTITPGTTGGIGTVTFSFREGVTTAYNDPRCVPSTYLQAPPPGAGAVVTIGGKTYTSPPASQWTPRSTTTPTTGCYGPAPAGQPPYAGQYFPDAVGTETDHLLTWSMNYSCRAAGTPVILADSSGVGLSTSIPANGPLPASCTSLSTAVPTITGTAKVGYTLTAVPGTWGPAPVALSYQWKANGIAITGATAATYKPGAAQMGKTITVTVTGTKAGYATAARTSTATAVVAPGTLGPAPVPAITGTAKVGYTLTAVPGTWGPAPVALTYQWKASGVAIIGATATTYKPGAAQIGKTITVTVTGKKAGYTTKSKTSAATVQIV
jgi:hypothetical protein